MNVPRKLGEASTAYTIPRDVKENPVRRLGGEPPPVKEAASEPPKEKT
jgi:hypothetical protein